MADNESAYSFVSDDGEQIDIAVDRLRAWIAINMSALDKAMIPVDRDGYDRIVHENAINPLKLAEVLNSPDAMLEPVIIGYDGVWTEAHGYPNAILIDGHHRFAAHFVRGHAECRAYLLPKSQWEPFMISGVPRMTKQQLVAIPPQSRLRIVQNRKGRRRK